MKKLFSIGIISFAAIVLAGCSGKDGETDTSANNEGSTTLSDIQNPSAAEAPAEVDIHTGTATLSNPSDFQMAVAYYNVLGLEPPYDEWVGQDDRVKQANEFSRPEVKARVQEEFLLAAKAAAGVGFVEINTRSNFGEYDMPSQGFRLDQLDSGMFWTWRYLGHQYKLTMENANDAQLWKIPVEEARALVENGGGRNVNLKLRIQIVGATPEGANGTLKGKILSYQVLNGEDRKIGEMSFE